MGYPYVGERATDLGQDVVLPPGAIHTKCRDWTQSTPSCLLTLPIGAPQTVFSPHIVVEHAHLIAIPQGPARLSQ